jgi:hypothetical protein
MEGQDIYVKTEKALEEIQNRTYKLPQKLRSLLIMIDGAKPVTAFMDWSKVLGDVSAMLVELEQQGFIKKPEKVPEPIPPQSEPPAQKTAETDADADKKKEYPEGSNNDLASLGYYID